MIERLGARQSTAPGGLLGLHEHASARPQNTVILPGSDVSTTPCPKLGCSTRSPTSYLSLARYVRAGFDRSAATAGFAKRSTGALSAAGARCGRGPNIDGWRTSFGAPCGDL